MSKALEAGDQKALRYVRLAKGYNVPMLAQKFEMAKSTIIYFEDNPSKIKNLEAKDKGTYEKFSNFYGEYLHMVMSRFRGDRGDAHPGIDAGTERLSAIVALAGGWAMVWAMVGAGLTLAMVRQRPDEETLRNIKSAIFLLSGTSNAPAVIFAT